MKKATFISGIILAAIGLFLLLKNITVVNTFGLNTQLYRFGGMPITSGIILIPFIIGIIMLFVQPRNGLGWILSLGSVALLIIGVITSLSFSMVGMNAFDILLIIALLGAGIGLTIKGMSETIS